MIKPLQHILCVDDEQDISSIVKMCLEMVGGYTVAVANSGAAAIAYANSTPPDLILVDVMMPEMDGPTTLMELRKNPALAQTPVIFMTARVQASEIQEYLQTGAAGVIAKPFDPMQISDQIKKIWEDCGIPAVETSK